MMSCVVPNLLFIGSNKTMTCLEWGMLDSIYFPFGVSPCVPSPLFNYDSEDKQLGGDYNQT